MTPRLSAAPLPRALPLLLGWLALACAHAPPPAADIWRDDPLCALPGGAAWVAQVAPYSLERLRWLERATEALAGSDDPVARLVLARAWVDALLWAEIAQDGPRIEALATLAARFDQGQGAWPWLATLLGGLRGDPSTQAALDDGLALVEALRERRLDAAYHQTLDRLAQGPWAHEARAARLLDLEETLGELQALPLDQRADALLEVLGPRVDPAQACALRLCEGRDGGQRGVHLRALLEQGAQDREALRADPPTPLSVALGPALEALWARAGRARVSLALAGPHLGRAVELPTSTGPSLPGEPGRWVVLREGWVFVAAPPILGLDELGVTRPDVALGWDLPGRPAVDLEAPEGHEPPRAHLVEGLAMAWAEAAALTEDPSVSFGADRAGPALDLIELVTLTQESLGAQGAPWEVGLGCWSPERGRVSRRRVVFMLGAAQPQANAQAWDVPEELAPKEVEVWLLGQEAAVRVGDREVWRGPLDELAAPAGRAAREGLGGAVVRVKVVGAQTQTQGLLRALDALEQGGLEVLVVR